MWILLILFSCCSISGLGVCCFFDLCVFFCIIIFKVFVRSVGVIGLNLMIVVLGCWRILGFSNWCVVKLFVEVDVVVSSVFEIIMIIGVMGFEEEVWFYFIMVGIFVVKYCIIVFWKEINFVDDCIKVLGNFLIKISFLFDLFCVGKCGGVIFGFCFLFFLKFNCLNFLFWLRNFLNCDVVFW